MKGLTNTKRKKNTYFRVFSFFKMHDFVLYPFVCSPIQKRSFGFPKNLPFFVCGHRCARTPFGTATRFLNMGILQQNPLAVLWHFCFSSPGQFSVCGGEVQLGCAREPSHSPHAELPCQKPGQNAGWRPNSLQSSSFQNSNRTIRLLGSLSSPTFRNHKHSVFIRSGPRFGGGDLRTSKQPSHNALQL